MDDNSGVPDPFYRPANKLLAQVSSHPLAEVIDIHLDGNGFKLLFVSTIIINNHHHLSCYIDEKFKDLPELETPYLLVVLQ